MGLERKRKKAKGFFDLPEWWENDWQGMPEFDQDERFLPFTSILVHFKNEADLKAFKKLVKQTVSPETKFIWYPKNEQENLLNYRYADSKRKSKKRKRKNR